MARGRRTDPTAAVLTKVMHEMGFPPAWIAELAQLPRKTVDDIVRGRGPWAEMPRSSTSFNSCAVPGLVEVPRTATRESSGTISFRSSSRFPFISGERVDNPVMLPPGRARLAHESRLPTGSASLVMTMGIVVVASLAARCSSRTSRHDNLNVETHQLGRERGEAMEFSLCKSPLYDDVFPLHVCKLPQALPECLGAGYPIRGGFPLWPLRSRLSTQHRAASLQPRLTTNEL